MAVDLALVQVRHGRFQNCPELGIATMTVLRWKNTGLVIRTVFTTIIHILFEL
jgi:hypothetical protein